MTITFQVDEYLPTAVGKQIYEPIVLPKGQMGNGIAACRAEMTVDGQTKEIWLSRSENLEPPPPRMVAFRDSVYQITYDVDRKPLGFELKLDDFDTGFEPGTEQATHFVSQVRLTDKSVGIKDQPHTISMNHPLDHRGYTFYQSNYIRVRDPQTRQFTGQFQSVFQVAKNPGRPIIYAGCFLVVLGTFLQFYMRAGIFTDGGKKERDRAAARLGKKVKRGRATVCGRRTVGPLQSIWMYCLMRVPIRSAASAANRGGPSGDPSDETNRQRYRWIDPGRHVRGLHPGAGSRGGQIAGHRAELRAARQGGRDARRARQATRHRRARRGQTGLQPRDDQAGRSSRGNRQDRRPRSRRSQGRRQAGARKMGARRCLPGLDGRSRIWDDKPFILVDYLPLRRLIMADERSARLKAIAAKSTTPADEKSRLAALANDEGVTAAALTACVRGSKLPDQDRQTIAELAAKLTEEHKWLTPRELDSAQITVKGQPVSFLEWASELQDQERRFNANPQSAQRLTELERRAKEVAMRLMTYKAYSGERLQTSDLVLIMPRPSRAQYLADTARSIKEARDKGTPEMPLWKLDELESGLDLLERHPSR